MIQRRLEPLVQNSPAGHKNAVVEVHWTADGERLISASSDKSVRAWDAATGNQVKKMAEHDNFVNSCCPLKRGPPLIVSGSDDGTAKVRGEFKVSPNTLIPHEDTFWNMCHPWGLGFLQILLTLALGIPFGIWRPAKGRGARLVPVQLWLIRCSRQWVLTGGWRAGMGPAGEALGADAAGEVPSLRGGLLRRRGPGARAPRNCQAFGKGLQGFGHTI